MSDIPIIYLLFFALNSLFFVLVVFQSEGSSNENFLLRILKLVLNVTAVLALAGGISFLIKVPKFYILPLQQILMKVTSLQLLNSFSYSTRFSWGGCPGNSRQDRR